MEIRIFWINSGIVRKNFSIIFCNGTLGYIKNQFIQNRYSVPNFYTWNVSLCTWMMNWNFHKEIVNRIFCSNFGTIRKNFIIIFCNWTFGYIKTQFIQNLEIYLFKITFRSRFRSTQQTIPNIKRNPRFIKYILVHLIFRNEIKLKTLKKESKNLPIRSPKREVYNTLPSWTWSKAQHIPREIKETTKRRKKRAIL